MTDTKPILYHFHISYAAQIARLAFAEKGVDYESFSLDIVASYEHYEPWYLKICPAGVVPALVDGDQSVLGSIAIARHVDAHYPGPSLTPEEPDARAEMETWLEVQQRFPERVLSMGRLRGKPGKMARGGIRKRIPALQALKKSHPELADVYDAKIDDIRAWIAGFEDPERLQKIDDDFERTLDELDARLSDGRDWIVGDQYTLADVAWSVTVARMHMMGMSHRVEAEKRPHVAAYLERARQRPSFRAAPVHLSVDKKVVLPLILRAKLPFLKGLIKVKR